ncbi:MAG TPA: PAS domain S-box protein, partial [Burkholderiales bacterium]|nr:PAS domain S-box protein [Burkholderiales bacterium]
MAQVLRVALLESSDADASSIERALNETGFAFVLHRSRSAAECAELLGRELDLVLAEWELPGLAGNAITDLMHARGIDVPVILLSRTISEEEGLQAVRRGAADYLLKHRLVRLKSAITTALEQKALRREANEARRALAQTEDEFRNAFERSPIGIAFVALDGRWFRVNDALCRITGYEAHELRAMSYSDVVHPFDRPGQARTLEQIVAGNEVSAEREIRFVRKNGSIVWVHITASMLRDAGGEPLYEMVQVVDISRSREAEERFRSTWEQAAVGMAHTTIDGRILLVNPELCRMLGLPEHALLGASLFSRIHEDDRSRAASCLKRLVARDVETAVEDLRFTHENGAPVWVSLSLSVVRDDTGVPQYCFAVVEGIAQRVSAEERFRSTFNQAAVGILHTQPDGGPISHANQRFTEMLGYTRDELKTKTVNDLTFPEDRGHDRERRLKLLRGEISHYNSERRFVRKDGSVLWAARTVSAARDASSGDVYFIQVIQDISERKQAEHDRQVVEARLARAN